MRTRITHPRARIVPDVRYPSGGYFNVIPGIDITGGSLNDFAERTGFYWYVISESGRFSSSYEKKSQEVWLLPNTRHAIFDQFNLTTTFGYDSESDSSFVSGFSRRPFDPTAPAYTGVNNIYCRSMEDLTSSVGSGYVFDRRCGLKLDCYDFSGVSGNSQWIVHGLTGSFLTNGPAYPIPDSSFDYSPITGSRNNVVTNTAAIYGFSGTMSLVGFDYDKNGIDNICSGRFYFDNTGSLGRYGVIFGYPTGIEEIVLKDEDGIFTKISGYYIEGNFTGRLSPHPLYGSGYYNTKRPNLTGIIDKYPIDFTNDSGYYRFITGHFADSPAASTTVEQIPYATITLNNYFSGETRHQLFKNGNLYQTFLASDTFTGDSRTGWRETNDLISGSPNEYKGVFPSGAPQTISTNDLTLHLESQILYRDYSVAPGLSYRYDSRVITDFTDLTSGVSNYSYDEYVTYPLKTQSGKYYFSQGGGAFSLITGSLFLDSSIPNFTGTIISLSDSQLPLTSANTAGVTGPFGSAGNLFVSRCRDIVNFTYDHQFQTGRTEITVSFPSNYMYDPKSADITVIWYDATSSIPPNYDDNTSP